MGKKLPGIPAIEKPKIPKTEIRPPRQTTRYATIPEGPALYSQKKERSDFPGEPPAGFLDPTLHGSRSEWPIYAGLWKYFDDQPRDGYLKPPYGGSPSGQWLYQSWQLGGRSISGGAVPDFEIMGGRRGESLILRIQSDRFHLTAGPDIVASDDLQLQRLSDDHRVIDLYEADYLNLRGSDLIKYIADVLSGKQILNPVATGSFNRLRGS